MPGIPNPPTSWFWNIRVGDKIQINNAGPWYTVVGPMVVYPTNPVTLGRTPSCSSTSAPPGTTSPLTRTRPKPARRLTPSILFLVNGQDDNNNGWIDEGWDGVDNNGDGACRRAHGRVGDREPGWADRDDHRPVRTCPTRSSAGRRRRPTPARSRCPSNVVIDLTTWGYPTATSAITTLTPSQERSRVPINIVHRLCRHRGQSRRHGRSRPRSTRRPRRSAWRGRSSISGWPSGAT